MALVLGELATILKANMDPFRKDLRKAKQYFKEHGDDLKRNAAIVGTAIAAALGAGLAGALEVDKAKAKLAAQLGGSAEYAADMGRIAGSVYMRGFGDSATAVGETLRGVLTSGLIAEDAADEEIEALVVKAQSLADVFGQDVTQTARAAGQMIRNGLAKNADEAFDLLTRGFQQSGDHAGDLLDLVSEYSTKFRDLGLDGTQALGLLQQGLRAGARDADTVADALKEFAIRAVDGSTASAEGFKALGLNAEKLTAQIARGGEGAKAGLDTVLDRLRAMKDPVARNAAAVALFGTKAEDLGDALYSLDVDRAADQLGNVVGATDKLGATLEETASQKLETFKRQAMGALSETMAQAIPYLETVVGFLGEHKEIVGPLAVGLGALAVVIGTVAAALKVWAVVQTVLNLELWTSPITWIVLAIIALVAVIVLIATKTTWFSDAWAWAWGGIKKAASAVGDWFVNTLWKKLILGAWNGIISAGTRVWDWFKALKGRIRDAFVGLTNIITAPYRAAFNMIARLWNGTIGKLSWTVPGWVPGVGGHSISAPKLPQLATGADVLESGLAIIHRGEQVVPEAKVKPFSGGGGGGMATLRLVVEYPDGRRIRDELIDAASLRGQSVDRYLGLSNA